MLARCSNRRTLATKTAESAHPSASVVYEQASDSNWHRITCARVSRRTGNMGLLRNVYAPTCFTRLWYRKEAQNFAHQTFTLISRENELRVRRAIENYEFFRPEP